MILSHQLWPSPILGITIGTVSKVGMVGTVETVG